MFDITEFLWTDTSEKIVDYRKRLSGNASLIQRFLCSKNAVLGMPVLALALGVVLAQLLSPIQKGFLGFFFSAIGLCVILLMALAAILISVITPLVHQRVCGVSDPRRLQ
jgi:hypothetical protein